MDARQIDSMPLWSDAPAEPDEFSQGRPVPGITPFVPASSEPTGAVVIFPGGGWLKRAPHEGVPVARWLTSLGVAALLVDYRVAPARHPAAREDGLRAIRMARANAAGWNIDPERIGVLGFSAGGHLAASTSVFWDEGDAESADPVERQSSRPDAAILCYPVISLLGLAHRGFTQMLFGETPQTRDLASVSVHLFVKETTPPTFLWHTAADPGVSVQHSLMMAAALAEKNVPFSLHVYPEGKHGLGLAKGMPAGAWTDACRDWLRGLGFCPR